MGFKQAFDQGAGITCGCIAAATFCFVILPISCIAILGSDATKTAFETKTPRPSMQLPKMGTTPTPTHAEEFNSSAELLEVINDMTTAKILYAIDVVDGVPYAWVDSAFYTQSPHDKEMTALTVYTYFSQAQNVNELLIIDAESQKDVATYTAAGGLQFIP